MKNDRNTWAPHVILVDADYLDGLAFDLTVNFERMLERRLPKADLCHWIDCVALDGGLERGDNTVQVHFLHSKEKQCFDFFRLTRFHDESHKLAFEADLNNMPFSDPVGSFTLFTFPVEDIVSRQEFFIQSFTMLSQAQGIENLMVVGDMLEYGDQLRRQCAQPHEKHITLYTMEPCTGRGFDQQILAYSVMSALGIRGEELNP